MKRFLSVLMIFLLSITLAALPAKAESAPAFVVDQADILSGSQEKDLEYLAQQASTKHECGIYIITLDDYRDLGDFDLIEDALDFYYDEMNYGIGPDRSAAILMLSMNDRDFSFLCFGDAYRTLEESDLDQITYGFLDDFANDSWYNGFADYIEDTSFALSQPGKLSGNTAPQSAESSPKLTGEVAVGLFASLIIAGIVTACVEKRCLDQMKSVHRGTQADHFVSQGGLQLQVNTDSFSHSETTRIYDPPAQTHSTGSRSYSGRSSGFRSSGIRSSGRSGRSSGRSGKF